MLLSEIDKALIYTKAFNDGYRQGVNYEREHIINIIENCTYRDNDMLVDLIKEYTKWITQCM